MSRAAATPRSLVLRPEGLVTDPNELGSVPQGALKQADNIVLRRQGIAEPRPGFEDLLSGLSIPANHELYAAYPFDFDVILLAWETAAGEWRILQGSDLSAITNPGTSFQAMRIDFIAIRAQEARGNLYLCNDEGITKVESASATAATFAGLLAPGVLWTGVFDPSYTDDKALLGGTSVAYRAVLRREDSNGYVVRSAPSPRIVVRGSASSTRDPDIHVTGYVSPAAGDVIELYRSLPTVAVDATPDDELYLAQEYTITAADVTLLATAQPPLARVKIRDNTAPGQLGAALYTNPSQQGILGSNFPPYPAHDLAQFKSCLFYGWMKTPHRLELRLTDLAGNTVDGLFNDTGLQMREGLTATAAVGNVQLTAVSSTTGIRVGMYISDVTDPFTSGTIIPADTQVTAVGASTVDMDAAASASGAIADLRVFDHITIGALAIVAQPNRSAAAVMQVRAFYCPGNNGDDYGEQVGECIESIVSAINGEPSGFYAYALEGDGGALDRIILERTAPVDNSFTLTTSAPDAFTPLVGAGLTSKQEDLAGSIAWSKPNQPEAVPLTNYSPVGDVEKAVKRLIPTRDALWIFKEDGLFRLSGNPGLPGAPGWRIDPVDPSLNLLAPNTVQILEETIFAWTTKGVVAIRGGAVTTISDDRISDQLEQRERELVVAPFGPGISHATVNPIEREYLLAPGPVDNVIGGDPADTIFVFSLNTNTWVKWTRTPRFLTWRLDRPGIALVNSGTFEFVGERLLSDTHRPADEDSAVTLSGVSGTTVTVSGAAVGDAIEQAAATYIILTLVSGSTFTVDRSGLIDGAATLYPAVTQGIQFTARFQGQPDTTKMWQGLQWLLRSAEDLYRIQARYSSDRNSTESTFDLLPDVQRDDQPQAIRHWVPRAHAWSERLYPALTIKSATAQWKLEALALEGAAESTAQRRSVS